MIIKIKVRTGKQKFNMIKGEEWVVDLTSRAKHGKANSELVKELSKIYNNVQILRGFKSKNKILEIEQL